MWAQHPPTIQPQDSHERPVRPIPPSPSCRPDADRLYYYHSLSPEEKAKNRIQCPYEGCTYSWLDPASGCRHMNKKHGRVAHHRSDFVARQTPAIQSSKISKRRATLNKNLGQKKSYEEFVFDSAEPMTQDNDMDGINLDELASLSNENLIVLANELFASRGSGFPEPFASSSSPESAVTPGFLSYPSPSGSWSSLASTPFRTPSPPTEQYNFGLLAQGCVDPMAVNWTQPDLLSFPMMAEDQSCMPVPAPGSESAQYQGYSLDMNTPMVTPNDLAYYPYVDYTSNSSFNSTSM